MSLGRLERIHVSKWVRAISDICINDVYLMKMIEPSFSNHLSNLRIISKTFMIKELTSRTKSRSGFFRLFSGNLDKKSC